MTDSQRLVTRDSAGLIDSGFSSVVALALTQARAVLVPASFHTEIGSLLRLPSATKGMTCGLVWLTM